MEVEFRGCRVSRDARQGRYSLDGSDSDYMMRVLESFVMSRAGDIGGGGDATLVSEHYAAVIDGVTGKTRLLFDSLRSDQFAAREVATAIHNLPSEIDGLDAVARISSALRDSVESLGFDSNLVSSPGATLGIVSLEREELWVIGDISALVDGVLLPGAPPPTDAVLCGLRAAYLSSLLLAGASVEDLLRDDPSQRLIEPMLEQQWLFANTVGSPWSYGVIDGRADASLHLKVVDISGAAEVVLFSDGFFKAETTLAGTLVAHRALVTADPLCIKEHQEFNACGGGGWDDMAYLRLTR